MAQAPAPAVPTVWTIDPTHSVVEFAVTHLMMATVTGRFVGPAGQIVVDDGDPTRSVVEVQVAAASVDTGVPQRDAHLRSPDFLDAGNHPSVRFVSRRITPLGLGGARLGGAAHQETGGRAYRVEGELTVRGITAAVAFEAVFQGEVVDPDGASRRAFTARATVRRSAFGIGWNLPLPTGGVLVGDEVEVVARVQAVLGRATPPIRVGQPAGAEPPGGRAPP